MNTCAVILAAGNGTRMCSCRPKIFCEVLFKPLVGWVVQNCKEAGVESLSVICSSEGLEELKSYFGENVGYCLQEQKLGTAHAVMQAEELLRTWQKQDVLILLGDVPFVDCETIKESYAQHKQQKNEATVIAADLEDPFGYGRIDEVEGKVRIVEERDATDTQRAIQRVNSGAMWFETKALLNVLDQIDDNNAGGEYYITTAVNILNRSGYYLAPNEEVILGANTNSQLLALKEVARKRIIEQKNEEGVEFVASDGVVIGPDVEIGKGTLIFPSVTIKGKSKIGKNCVITAGSVIEDSFIGDGCEIKASYITSSQIADGAQIGPFAQLRPGSFIGKRTKIGNFVEIKNSQIEEGAKIPHLSYIGDSVIGTGANIGCGCATANYDGTRKHKTKIGKEAFVGCNSCLVAPVTVGAGAFVAAGSVITKDIEPESFAISRARQVNKIGYMKQKKNSKADE